jgi:hypothetical protein
MATDAKKAENQLKMHQMIITGMALGIWDLIGETAKAISPRIGEQLLTIAEKEAGLEIAGESPDHILTEVGRLFVDEIGGASAAELEVNGNELSLKLRDTPGRELLRPLVAAGVEPFFEPVMCIGVAALARLGKRARVSMEAWEEGKGGIIHFELV